MKIKVVLWILPNILHAQHGLYFIQNMGLLQTIPWTFDQNQNIFILDDGSY